MLSGRAPFHARSRDESATAVIDRIKAGEFDFHASAWQSVSHEAKNLTKGNRNDSSSSCVLLNSRRGLSIKTKWMK